MTPLRYLSLALALFAISFAPASAGATPVLDQAYAGSGSLTPRVFEASKKIQIPNAYALQSDGKLLLAMGLDLRLAKLWHRPVLRYNADGTKDATFGNAGVAWVRVRGFKRITMTGIVTGSQGDLFVYGEMLRPDGETIYGAFVAHLGADGVQDMNFGDRGAIRFVRRYDIVESVSVEPDGLIYVTDQTTRPPKYNAQDMRIRRFLSSGRPDSNYADNGVNKIRFPRWGPDQFIVSDGVMYTLNNQKSQYPCDIRRYLLRSDGRRDYNYGSNGTVHFDLRKDKRGNMGCRGFAPARGGKLLLGDGYGLELRGHYGGYVARLDSNGQLDPTFGDVGIWFPPDPAYGALVTELADGTVLTQGRGSGSGLDYSVGALTPNGLLDKSFGNDGFVPYSATSMDGFVTSGNTAIAIERSDYGSFRSTRVEIRLHKFFVPEG